jgi:hypothetical protein
METGNLNDFGFLLSRARSELDMSIHDLSRLTRIPVHLIQALENSDHASLPEDIYVKGFIRSCCKILRLDSDIILSAYIESRDNFFRAKKKFDYIWISRKTFLAALLVVCIIFGLFDLYSGKRSEPEKNNKTLVSDILSEPSSSVSGEEQSDNEKEMIMTVYGRDNAVMKIIRDGGYPEKIDVIQGSSFNLRAKKYFNILLESPRNVVISFNGKHYNIPGNEQVVNIFYP